MPPKPIYTPIDGNSRSKMCSEIAVSIIIVSWNVKRYVEECLSSINTQTKCSYETIVVDNASNDKTAEHIRQKFPKVKLIENQNNFGFARANNQGIQVSRGRYIVLLNPDTRVVENAIDRMVELMDANTDVYLAGGKLLNPDGTLQPSVRNFPNPIRDFLFISGLTTLFRKLQKKFILAGLFGANNSDGWELHKGYVSGAFLTIRRELLKEIGFLDEGYSLYFEETDFCYRCLQHSHKIAYFPSAEVIHYGGQSSSQIGAEALVKYCKSLFNYYSKFWGSRRVLVGRFAVFTGSIIRFFLLFFSSLRSPGSIIDHCETCFKIAITTFSSNKGDTKSLLFKNQS